VDELKLKTETSIPVEELTVDDVLRLAEKGPGRLPTQRIVRVRHHRIAELLALGRSAVDISRIMGLHPNTIGYLQKAPSFRQLIQHYREKTSERDYDTYSRMEEIRDDALERLHEVLRDQDEVPLDWLRQTAFGLLDRTGLGPIQRVESRNVNVGLTREDLLEIKRLAQEADRGAALGEGEGERTVQALEVTRIAGEGEGV
jgi:hypothetical protein